MKYIYTILLLIVLYPVLLPAKSLSLGDNQLITEVKINDNDSTFRYLYLYDNLGNKVVETKFFQQDSTWIRQTLNEWIYNGNMCILQRESQWKDTGWKITYTIDFEYYNKQLLSETHNIYNNGVASLLKKIDFQYNNTYLNSKKEYEMISNAWSLSLETDFINFQNGKADSIITKNFQSGNIINQYLSTFVYNSDSNLLSQLFQQKTGNDWLNIELTKWFYSTNSSMSTIIQKKWMTDTSSWENTQRIDNQYNDSFELISERYQQWSSMYWKNTIRYDYLYDNKNRLLKKTLSEPIYNDWRGLISINYSHFIFDKPTQIESMFEFWGGNTGELTTSYIPFMFNTDLSIQKGRSIFISSLPIIDTLLNLPSENYSSHLIQVYPNPSDGIFYINTQKYNVKLWTVSDLNGHVLKKQVQPFQTGVIDLMDFQRGIYILRVITNDEQMIQKLIKE